MIETTVYTWLIAVFGVVTFLPLWVAQLFMIFKPNSRRTKDLIIGKSLDWRDKTHYKTALAFAWADLLLILPLFIFGNIGVFSNELWGYIIWFALGVLSIYFSILFWILEKEYTYPASGGLAYYTYFWGFFLYWGIAAAVFSIIQIL